uniref:Uncharacterized protein n=1 Tax=Suricata suricatta TaxID=37032 RepID=A0A673TM90_SURSU
MLKEELKKHGIVLNSEITTNGETADTLNNVGHQGPTKLTKEEVNALKAVGDGPLGRASEVEVKSEIVENVGEKGVLQHTEQEQHKEDPARERVDTEVFHPGRDAKDQKASEDRAPSLGVLANGPDGEQGQTWDLENAPSVEDAEQAESGEVTHTPDDRTAASLERSSGSGDLDGGSPGAGSGRDGYSASDVRSQSRESGEAQEGWQTGPGAGSAKPGQDSASPQVSEVGGLASVDVGEQAGSPPEGVAEAGLPGLGEQAGTVANGPPRYSSDTRRDDERHVVDAPTELDPSSGPDLEKEAPGQGVAELQEFPVESTAVGGESEEKDQERALRAEKPIQTEGQNIPCCPAAKSSPQGAAGPSVADPESEPLDTKEPEEGKNDQQGEASDSSQKKTKNKKKKNKKKKPPTPVESLNDVKKELTFQNPDLSEVKEEEQVNFTDEKSAVEAQDEVPESPKKESVAGTGGNVGGPENPEVELNENRDQEDSDVNTTAGKEAADGDTLGPGDDTTQSSGACAGDEEPDEAEAVVRDEAKEDGAAAGVPEPGSALLENGGPLADLDGASQTGSPQRQEMAECPSPTVRKAVENEDDSAASGELGAPESDPPSGGSEKGKSKEDCRLS